MMFQKKKVPLAIGIGLVILCMGIILGRGWGGRVSEATEVFESLKIFTEVLSLVEKNYVEEVQTKDLIYGSVRGMLSTLDPHSAFMPPDLFREMQVDTKGEFGGLGLQIGVRENRLIVISPIEGTPADRAGIRPGDHIAKVDGESTKEMSIMDAVNHMRGPKGSKVTLTIIREGVQEPLTFTLVRDIIKIMSVRQRLLEGGIGYVRVSQFQEQTGNDFGKALKKLNEKEQIQSLILDLRNNPGGLLTSAVEVTEQFAEEGKLIVYIQGRDGKKDEYLSKNLSPFPSHVPMVVLVNEGSASASEIVSGALQDWGRAVVVGTQTFGKGSVQTILPLSDGSAVRLTTAKYYTPKDRSIHNKGIAPDIVVTMPPPPPSRREPGPPEEEKKEEEDPQLQKAIELLRTWKIFKGFASGQDEGSG